MSDQPLATVPSGRRWLTMLLLATALAAVAIVAFAASAFSSSNRPAGSTGGAPSYQQVQQNSPGHDCPNRGRNPSNDQGTASFDT